MDRTVALLSDETDIREVIAFAKTKTASDPMPDAPSPVSQDQLDVLSIAVQGGGKEAAS